jgi:LemA protein
MRAVWTGIAVVVVLLLVLFGCRSVALAVREARNEIVAQKQAITDSWQQADNVMQRLAELIPNLEESIQGDPRHDPAAIQEVEQARAAFARARSPQERIQAYTRLDAAVSRVLAMADNNPHFKADQQFLGLRRELAGTENRIAIERRRYNEAIQTYNTNIQLFPKNIVASMEGYTREDAYFKTEPGAHTAPKGAF